MTANNETRLPIDRALSLRITFEFYGETVTMVSGPDGAPVGLKLAGEMALPYGDWATVRHPCLVETDPEGNVVGITLVPREGIQR